MKKVLVVVAGLSLAAWLCSCKTPSAATTVESYPKTKITVNSKVVGEKIQVVEYAATNRNALLQVQISVQNITQDDVPFEYRFRWKNEAGMELPSLMATWIPISVSAKETQMLQAMAPTQEAKDFVFEVRFVRPSTRW